MLLYRDPNGFSSCGEKNSTSNLPYWDRYDSVNQFYLEMGKCNTRCQLVYFTVNTLYTTRVGRTLSLMIDVENIEHKDSFENYSASRK